MKFVFNATGVVTLNEKMERNVSQTLLVEAAMLITATRVRIARSVRLLGKLPRDGVRMHGGETLASGVVRQRSSTHPPSAPPL